MEDLISMQFPLFTGTLIEEKKLILGVAAFLSSCRSKIKDFGLDSGSKEEDTSFSEEGSDIICEEQKSAFRSWSIPIERGRRGGLPVFFRTIVHLLVMCISEENGLQFGRSVPMGFVM